MTVKISWDSDGRDEIVDVPCGAWSFPARYTWSVFMLGRTSIVDADEECQFSRWSATASVALQGGGRESIISLRQMCTDSAAPRSRHVGTHLLVGNVGIFSRKLWTASSGRSREISVTRWGKDRQHTC